MTSFISKKNIEHIIKDGVIITTGTAEIFFGLKAAGLKLPSLDAMFIIKLAGGVCGMVLVKDYAFHKKWINE